MDHNVSGFLKKKCVGNFLKREKITGKEEEKEPLHLFLSRYCSSSDRVLIDLLVFFQNHFGNRDLIAGALEIGRRKKDDSKVMDARSDNAVVRLWANERIKLKQ